MSGSWYRNRDRRFPRLLSLDDFAAAARRALPRPIYGYVAGAAEENLSLQDNRRAFAELALLPRVLRGVAARDASMTLFGHSYAAPFGVAPMGLLSLSAYRGDLALARAAAAANLPFVIAGSALLPLERIVEAAPNAWFQAYLPGDPGRIRALLDRVAAAGIRTLVVTVDMPVAGNRENLVRSGFDTPLKPGLRLALDGLARPRWLFGNLLRTLLTDGMPHFENSFAERGAPIISSTVLRDFSARDHFEWGHIAAIREQWRGQLVIKGVLRADDAALARQHGADAVWLSNHGGRQLDGAIAPLRVLPEVRARTGDMPILLDSGVRRGTDVLKALALGASGVFLGRPFNFAVAAGGQAGAAHAIGLLREEIDRDMALLGVRSLSELEPGMVRANPLREEEHVRTD